MCVAACGRGSGSINHTSKDPLVLLTIASKTSFIIYHQITSNVIIQTATKLHSRPASLPLSTHCTHTPTLTALAFICYFSCHPDCCQLLFSRSVWPPVMTGPDSPGPVLTMVRGTHTQHGRLRLASLISHVF